MTSPSACWHLSYLHRIEYEVVDCPGVLDPHNDALLSVGNREDTGRFVIVDENVYRLRGAGIRNYFAHHRVDARIVAIPGGEQNKSVQTYLSLLTELDSYPIERRAEPIIVIGGGVLTDLAGFVAATYRRGVPHIKVPTTLMAYVDAAVGIKNGVNLNGHKNRLGSFEAPQKVLLDRTFLETLPRRHILNGVCEIVKLAVVADLPLLEMLEADGAGCIASKFQDERGARLLDHSIERMLGELEPNLLEENLSRTMDFGHTFVYGLETAAGCDVLHGEAVLLDVLLSATLAARRGMLSDADLKRILDLVATLGLVVNPVHLDPAELWDSVQERMLHRDGAQRIPLPDGLGKCVFVNDVTMEELQAACKELSMVKQS
jgi:2-epi-5-epi-valiolone synthase